MPENTEAEQREPEPSTEWALDDPRRKLSAPLLAALEDAPSTLRVLVQTDGPLTFEGLDALRALDAVLNVSIGDIAGLTIATARLLDLARLPFIVDIDIAGPLAPESAPPSHRSSS